MTDLLADLSDRSVALILQEVTESLADTDSSKFPQDVEEAHALIVALLTETQLLAQHAVSFTLFPDERSAARQLLAHFANDPATAEQTRIILADPPADEQLSVELAASAAVLLGALVGWLQTKIDIKIDRKEGRTDFSFRITKSAAAPDTLGRVARTVQQIASGRDPM